MISNIVQEFNNSLKSAFGKLSSDINQICETIIIREGEDVLIPAIIGSNGDCIYVFTDDNFEIGIYHKLLSKTYQNQPNRGYGDNNQIVTDCDLELICWGNRSNGTPEEFEQILLSNSPAIIKFKSTNFNSKQVFSGEFSGIQYFLPPEIFLFSVKYQVQYKTIEKSCLEIKDKFKNSN